MTKIAHKLIPEIETLSSNSSGHKEMNVTAAINQDEGTMQEVISLASERKKLLCERLTKSEQNSTCKSRLDTRHDG